MTRQSIGRGVAIGIGTTLLSAALLGAWSSKESKAAHDSDVRTLQKQDSLGYEAILDVLCSKNVDPTNRRCKR